jgi:pre-rRNA-processing protein IPI1
MIPKRSNAFAHLNLFGASRGEDGEMYVEREERQKIFHQRFYAAVQSNVETARKEGGDGGRAAARVGKALAEGMEGFESDE